MSIYSDQPKQMHVKYSMHALLRVLKDAGADEYNPMPKSEALHRIQMYLEEKGLLQDFDKTLNNSGRIRWENALQFYFILLRNGDIAHRKRGQWWITDKGKELAEESPDAVNQIARDEHRKWLSQKKQANETTASIMPESSTEASESDETSYDAQSVLDNAQSEAKEGIKAQLKNIDEYDFQDLVADILTATGLTVQYVAPRGRDGGVDITATTDVLGVQQPRLRVQVKHYINSGQAIPPKDIQALRGAIKTDAGMFVTSSRFTKESKLEAAHAPYIKLVDLDGLLDLLDQYYDNLPPRAKNLLPLKKVLFISDGE